jgi:hypothetical protein
MTSSPVTVPARSPVDDALDRLEVFGRMVGRVVKPEFDAHIATVREALERLREERDEWERKAPVWTAQAVEPWQHRSEAAEVEVLRLTAELKLATEGLRETKAALDRERGGGSPLTHKEYLALHERVRALLSANPPQGDAADFCEHGYTTEDSAHPSAGLERCPTCSPSDGGGAK